MFLAEWSNSTVRRSPKQLLESRRHRNAQCGWRCVMFRSTRNPKKKWTAQRKVVMFSLIYIYFYLAILAKSSCSSCKAWSISARGGEALVVQSSTFSRCCHPFGCPGYTVRKFASSSAWCAGSTSGADLVKFGALTNISTSKLEVLNLWFYRHLGCLTCMLVDEWLVKYHDVDVEWFCLNLSYLTDCSQKVVNVPFPSVAPLCKCCVGTSMFQQWLYMIDIIYISLNIQDMFLLFIRVCNTNPSGTIHRYVIWLRI